MTRPGPTGALVWVALAGTVCLVSADAQAPTPREPLHVAFTSSMFAGVNLNDARAAVSVWAETVARGQGAHLETTTEVYDDLDTLAKAMDAGKVHLVSLSIPQYRQLRRPQFGSLLIGGRRGRIREEFLLVVRTGGFRSLSDLKGRTLVTVDGIGRDMSADWLEASLLEAGLGPTARHFASVMTVAKPSRALLPVFFGQQDPCLTTRHGYELMVELNPQLGSALTALATSTPMEHGVLAFDLHYAPARRATVLQSLLALHRTPRGQQILNLFGLDLLIEATPADLTSSMDLLNRLDRLRGKGQSR